MVLNGINIKGLSGTVNLLYARPELANFKFKLNNQWTSADAEQISFDNLLGKLNEDPDVLLDSDHAPKPVENLLNALAECITTSMLYHATLLGYKIKGIKTNFEGDMDLRGFLGLHADSRTGFKEIRIGIEIDGDITEQEKEDIVQLGTSFSPVLDIVNNGVPVRLKLNKTASSLENIFHIN